MISEGDKAPDIDVTASDGSRVNLAAPGAPQEVQVRNSCGTRVGRRLGGRCSGWVVHRRLAHPGLPTQRAGNGKFGNTQMVGNLLDRYPLHGACPKAHPLVIFIFVRLRLLRCQRELLYTARFCGFLTPSGVPRHPEFALKFRALSGSSFESYSQNTKQITKIMG